MAYQWVKLWVRILDDRPTQQLPDSLYRRFLELMCVAAEYGQGGLLPAVEDIAFRLRLDESQMEDDLKRLTLKPHVSWNAAAEAWEIVNWDKYQGPMSAIERKRLQRERDRKTAVGHADVTSMSRNVTQTKDKTKDKTNRQEARPEAADAAGGGGDIQQILESFGISWNRKTQKLADCDYITEAFVGELVDQAEAGGKSMGWVVNALFTPPPPPKLVNCRICLERHPAGQCAMLQEVTER